MDTSGDQQFPAMRRLSIATAHAFLLVYATTSGPSFLSIKKCMEELREQRADYQVRLLQNSNNNTHLCIDHNNRNRNYEVLACPLI